MSTSFEGLDHRAFQGHRERCFKDAPTRWILDGEDVLQCRSTLDVMFESGKLAAGSPAELMAMATLWV